MRSQASKPREELRVAIEALPRQAREAMLRGIESGPIIAGAYSSPEGICPMLAAHRCGGRSNVVGFARAWDRFAFGGRRRRRSRRATERELLLLKLYLQASLLSGPAAEADHPAPVPPAASASAPRRAVTAPVPLATEPLGDRDRSRELGARPGWSWTPPVRRYDDYQRLLAGLESPATRADPVLS